MKSFAVVAVAVAFAASVVAREQDGAAETRTSMDFD